MIIIIKKINILLNIYIIYIIILIPIITIIIVVVAVKLTINREQNTMHYFF